MDLRHIKPYGLGMGCQLSAFVIQGRRANTFGPWRPTYGAWHGAVRPLKTIAYSAGNWNFLRKCQEARSCTRVHSTHRVLPPLLLTLLMLNHSWLVQDRWSRHRLRIYSPIAWTLPLQLANLLLFGLTCTPLKLCVSSFSVQFEFGSSSFCIVVRL